MLTDLTESAFLAARAESFCSHGVPAGSHCRWCTTGTEPVASSESTPSVRAARVAAIRAEWAAYLARVTK